ncbi:MAG: tetratricopeptide repeat protein [Spirulina sp. SIO3F2]|nr:tetratricopeptide repeat protein [Spirulina sp. SIO3F2]
MVEPLLKQRYEILQVLQQAPLVEQFLGCDTQAVQRDQCSIYAFAVQDHHPEILDYARQLFDYEVQRLVQLSQHPTIPNYIDSFEAEGKFYVVQQWLPGQTLAQILAAVPHSTVSLVFDLLRSLASTLAFVHEHNTLHCNLSPQNIVWHEASQSWIILNFGAFYQVGLLGIDPAGDVQLLGRLGVPGYIPDDEQTPLNPQYDFYSLGMIALEALLGERPTQPQTWRDRLTTPVEGSLADCLNRLLTGAYTRATEIIEDLQDTELVAPPTLAKETEARRQTYQAPPTFSDTVSFSDLLLDELPPDTLLAGRYRLVHPLSHGGFGQTYLAVDEQFPGQPQCVVKKLKPQHDSPRIHKIARQMFQREAEVLSRLGQHPQIPQLMAHFEEDEEFYLVEEFIDGHDLEAELPLKIKLPEVRVVRLLTDILEVLSFVHDQKVVHRDLKPANIRRRKHDSQLVLIDFGAVKQLNDVMIEADGKTKLTVSIGTAGFAPSEQTQGRPRLSSDVYAVGMLGIQALTGVDPEAIPQDPKTGELLWQPLAKASPALESVMSQMVRYDFRQRYPSARQALQALQQLNAPQRSPESLEAPKTAEVIPTNRLKRYLLPLGLTAGLTLVGGVGVLGYQLGWFNPSIQALRQRIVESTVEIHHADGQGFSTGVLIEGTSYECRVLTNRRAIDAGREVTVVLGGSNKTVDTIKTFEGLDLVELNISSEMASCGYPALPLGDSTQIRQEEGVYLGGFVQPQGMEMIEHDLLPTTIEQVLEIPITGGYRLAYSTAMQRSLPGNVVVNRRGQVVGIHGSVADDLLNAKSQGLSWAIPIRTYLIATESSRENPDTAKRLQDEADQFFAAQRYEESLAAYERLIQLRPKRPEPWYGKGSSLYNLQRYEEAIEAYDEALALREENSLIWYSRGNAYFLLEQYEAAKESYERALQYKTDYFTALNNLGLTWQALEDYDQALEIYEAVIELRPQYHSAWNNKGTILSLQGDWTGAIAAYDQAIQLRPTFSNAWYNRAIAYSQQNDIPNALASLKEAIALRKLWSQTAQEDTNFEKLRTNPEFRALVGL